MLDKNKIVKAVESATEINEVYIVCKNMLEKEGFIVKADSLQFSIEHEATGNCKSWLHFGTVELEELKKFIKGALDEFC